MWKKLGAVPLLLRAPQKCCRTKGPSTWFSVVIFMSHSPWRTPPFTSAFASWVYKGWLIFRATILNMGAITIPYFCLCLNLNTCRILSLLSVMFSVFVWYFVICLELLEFPQITLKPLGVDFGLSFKD